MSVAIEIDRHRIADFCRRWTVKELSLFGSVLRDDFRPDSDVDVLVDFRPGVSVSLSDYCRMEDELADILGRQVDLVMRTAVEESPNYIRRRSILTTREPIHVER
jgi:predicted nucleotidyltransferase